MINPRTARAPGVRRPARRTPLTLDQVLLAFHDGRLQFLSSEPGDGARGRRELPWAALDAADSLDGAARQAVREAVSVPPAWLEQLGVFDSRKRHPADAPLSLAFVALLGDGGLSAAPGYEWSDMESASQLPPRQRAMLEAATVMLRQRVDFEPVAFHLLPSAFTLSELQQIYEQVLGHRLHKASFRRALQAAELVQPLNEFRTEGRGRPAQLYRYAPRSRKPPVRSARFELLSRG